MSRVAGLPGKTLKNLEFYNLGKKNLEKPGIWEIKKKTWNFDQKPGSLTIFTFSIVKFRFDSKNQSYKKKFHHQKSFLLKNIFKVALQYLFNVFILLKTVSYLKLNLS